MQQIIEKARKIRMLVLDVDVDGVLTDGRLYGEGAVREVCELIMSAQGSLESALAPYLTDPL